MSELTDSSASSPPAAPDRQPPVPDGEASGVVSSPEAQPASTPGQDVETGSEATGGDPAHGSDSGLAADAPVEDPPSSAPAGPASKDSHSAGPSFVFFGAVAAVSLLLDVASKAWAEIYFNHRLLGHSVKLVDQHLSLVLAYNKGGAWGLGHGWSDALRLPFFLLVSVAAIVFIVSLYARLLPRQHALKWGLPLVLGGALGNLTDRIVRNQVIDFIDYRADWVRSMNEWLAGTIVPHWSITDHWPTFNVADVAICAGVGLMAVDMLVSRRGGAVEAGPVGPVHPEPIETVTGGAPPIPSDPVAAEAGSPSTEVRD